MSNTIGSKLPQQLTLDQLQNKWASILNPTINSSIVNGSLLTGVSLDIGTNIINHKLGRKLQGWILVGVNAPAQIYDNQDTNQMSNLTLSLTSDAITTIALWVF